MSKGCNCCNCRRRQRSGPHSGRLITAQCGGVSPATPHLCPESRSGTRPHCSLRSQDPSQPQQSHGVSRCAGWWQAVTGAFPLGSSHGKGAVCGSCGKPPCWHRQSKVGVLLEAAMPALPWTARFALPPPVLRPGRAEKLILSMTRRGYFFAFRSLPLSLPFTAHPTLPCGTSPSYMSSMALQGCFSFSPVPGLGFPAFGRC